MICQLNYKKAIDVYEFLNRVPDKFEEIFVTSNRERKYLKGNLKLIKKILNTFQVYGKYEKELKSIVIIQNEKGFRSYIKVLGETTEDCLALLRFIKWNYAEKELFAKLKKDNPISKRISEEGFIPVADRGREQLYKKSIYKMRPLIIKEGDEDANYRN